jgi:hypothetical protein
MDDSQKISGLTFTLQTYICNFDRKSDTLSPTDKNTAMGSSGKRILRLFPAVYKIIQKESKNRV